MAGTNRPVDNRIAGHVPADSHAHIHRHNGELYAISLRDASLTSGDTLELVINNPNNSGKVLEILGHTVVANDAGDATYWRDGGIYTGNHNSLTPENYLDGAGAPGEINVEHATNETLVDTANDTPFYGGDYFSSSQGANVQTTLARATNLDVTVAENRSFAYRINATNAMTPFIGVTIAEYRQDRPLQDL